MNEPNDVDLERELRHKLESAQAKGLMCDRINKSGGNTGYVVIELTSMGGSTGVQLFSTGPEIPHAFDMAKHALSACKARFAGNR